MYKQTFKVLIATIAISWIYGCNRNSEKGNIIPELEKYQVSFSTSYNDSFVSISNSKTKELDENGIPLSINYLGYFIKDLEGNQIKSEEYFDHANIPLSIELPPMEKGNYSILVLTENSSESAQAWSGYLEFEVIENVSHNLQLKQYQTRYKFVDISNFTNEDIDSVRIMLHNIGQTYIYNGNLESIDYGRNTDKARTNYVYLEYDNETYYRKTTLSEFNSPFLYRNKLHVSGYEITFFDSSNEVLYNIIIDTEDKWFEFQKSYTINVDLEKVWNTNVDGFDKNVPISYDEQEWTEESIDLN